MSLLFYIVFTLLLAYGAVLLWLAVGFLILRKQAHTSSKQLPVTIIICARNEEKTIARCLHSVLGQSYDREKIQLIVINDASRDTTVQQAEAILRSSDIKYSIISNPEQKGKKQSISYAMQFAEHALIILRDADTFTTSTKWLQSISDFQNEKQADLVIGPIAIADNYGSLWALQAIENDILSVTAAGSAFYRQPFLCSGANLIFPKATFEKTNGYSSHLDVASGDDIFFMEDVKRLPNANIQYLKNEDAIVQTYPVRSFGKLLQQKIRWASKFKRNTNVLNAALAVLSFAVNLAWLFIFVHIYLAPLNKALCLTFLLGKLGIDLLLLFLASRFIKHKGLWWYALPVGCIYPVYAVMVGLASLFMKPKWKA